MGVKSCKHKTYLDAGMGPEFPEEDGEVEVSLGSPARETSNFVFMEC